MLNYVIIKGSIMPKYIFVNGVMKLDPSYQGKQDPNALTVVSSTKDIQEASQAQERATGKPMQVSESAIASMEIMQDSDYIKKFNTKVTLDGGELLDGISNVFAKYEVPIGLINKLLALTEYNLNFIIDDSGSMGELSDVSISQATPQVRQVRDPSFRRSNEKMTRWEEAEDRLHILIDMLSYLPIDKINLSFFNNKANNIELTHRGKTPEQFADEAHKQISRLFNFRPSGRTPLYRCLSEAFKTRNNTMHYVFTDGEPSDANIEQVKELVKTRDAKMNPLTFISCTNNDEECAWMKEVEEVAPSTSEIDDFNSERNEVYRDQGPAFPYTRGFWLISMLVSAINPFDLDKMDESVPFTKKTMNDLMGRNITLEEYRYYFQMNPNAAKYRHQQNQFEREDILAHHIMNPGMQNNPSTGPSNPFSNQPTYAAPAPASAPYPIPSPASNAPPAPYVAQASASFAPPAAYQQQAYGNNSFFNSPPPQDRMLAPPPYSAPRF
jgi:hypothetical protein